MDVRLSAAQITYLYDKEKDFKTNKGKGSYTDIGRGQHFSWQANKTIVVGEDGPPKRHQNFTCAITSSLGITLTASGGALPAASIDVATMTNKVTLALKARLRLLAEKDTAFNNIGRSGQQLEFHSNPIVNRHDTRWLLIGIGHAIKGGGTRTLTTESVRGFTIYQPEGTTDSYYRNYDIREVLELEYEEPLRLLHEDKDTVKLLRNTGEVVIAML